MAVHSSILAWKIPWTEEPGGWAAIHEVTKSMFRAEVLKYHGSYNMQILRQDSGRKEKLGQGQTKYMFLTLQWQKSEVSTKGQWKI